MHWQPQEQPPRSRPPSSPASSPASSPSSSPSPSPTGSGRLISGVLSQPHPVIHGLVPGSVHEQPARYESPADRSDQPDTLADLADLTPTEPQLPSIPKAPRVSRQPDMSRRVRIASEFSEFMLGQDWTHDTALAAIPIMRRMRLFSVLAPVYLSVIQATGRMRV